MNKAGELPRKAVVGASPEETESPAAHGQCEAGVQSLRIDERRYRLVCVDGEVPRHVSSASSARQRLLFHPDEVAHFSIGERRYALVSEADHSATPEQAAPEEALRWEEARSLLTGREIQIVHLICLGLLTKQVADRLHLSEFTVRSYLKTVYCKLGVRSRGGLAYSYAKVFGTAGAAASASLGKR